MSEIIENTKVISESTTIIILIYTNHKHFYYDTMRKKYAINKYFNFVSSLLLFYELKNVSLLISLLNTDAEGFLLQQKSIKLMKFLGKTRENDIVDYTLYI